MKPITLGLRFPYPLSYPMIDSINLILPKYTRLLLVIKILTGYMALYKRLFENITRTVMQTAVYI
jgi:hypothetical protein